MPNFDSFGLAPSLLQAIADLNFEKPTPVQRKVLPMILGGSRDLVALAQTGTGKTAAYGLPLVQMTDQANPAIQAVILCPTRELCMQITKDLAGFAKHTPGVRIVAVYGGAPVREQVWALQRGAHIVVATPGRMNDLLRHRNADLSQVQRVVLDEADEMLNMGFQEELEAILSNVPEDVRKLLFSATMSKAVAAIAGKYMRNPEEVVVGQRNAGSENVSHECYKVHAKDRYPALKRILDFHRNVYGIVFCRTRAETQEVAANLMRDGYNADALHGEMMQEQRDAVMKKFRARELQLLVATDVAARGLDVTHLTHVINYNLPDEPEGYTHRSGRTGRAGKAGTSIVIVNMREEFKLRTIEQIIKKTFIHKTVPTLRNVCESQILGLVERLKGLDTAHPMLDSMLPVVTAALAEMTPDEVLKRFVLLECKRFWDEDKGLSEVTQGDRHQAFEPGARRGNPGDMVTMEINLGRRNRLTPAALITLINRATRGPMVRLGKIRIQEQISSFEAPLEAATDLEASLTRGTFDGRKIGVRIAPGDTITAPHPHAHSRSKGGGHS